MQSKSINSFFKDEYVNQASYDNLRKIASAIDGLKNSSRKVICTALDKNVNENLKVSQFANKAAEHCEYLHGDLSGVVVNLAKSYAGANNLVLLDKKGNFGTRLNNEASAPRYIFTRKSSQLDNLFLKSDSGVLIEQFFEGVRIEPKFYVPTLPLLLINGSDGISSGFSQKILSRDAKEIKTYLVNVLTGKRVGKFPLPKFNGFSGIVKQGEQPNQFIISGTLEKAKKNTVIITELPIGYDLASYISVLDKLEEDKKIKSYKDLSDEKFLFEISLDAQTYSLSEDELLDLFKLIKRVSENYTSLDENNSVVEFESPVQILEKYIDVKLQFLNKRKDNIVRELNEKIDLNSAKLKFITNVISGKLMLNNRRIDDVIADLRSLDLPSISGYDYLLKLPMSSLTTDELDRLKKQIDKSKQDLSDVQSKTNKDMFLDDILLCNL